MRSAKKKTTTVFHPILIGAYTSVAFLANNISQLNPVLALRTILFSLLFAVIIFTLFALLTRDKVIGGILASLGLLQFTVYGHIYNLLENRSFLGHHSALLPINLFLFAGFVFLVLRFRKFAGQANFFLNLTSFALILMPLFMIVRTLLRPVTTNAPLNPAVDSAWTPASNAAADTPDVYYIILDAYSREDILRQVFNYDNGRFLAALEKRGFYVVDCSLSNYNQTVNSISSTLNMDYLDKFASAILERDLDFHRLGATIKHSKVREIFTKLGYQFVSFETGYWWLDIVDADRFVSQYPSPWLKLLNFKYISDFEKDYLNTTALRPVYELKRFYELKHGKPVLSPEKAHYEMVSFSLNALEEIPEMDGPKFVYAHLVAPHFPYVFRADGTFYYEEADDPGYIDELTFVNHRILEVIDALIANSDKPPVIILQGDHGLKMDVRNANLSAYYFPGVEEELFYPTITPVNTFRLLFNTYFDATYPLLPDVARISSYQHPFDFEIYEDHCKMK